MSFGELKAARLERRPGTYPGLWKDYALHLVYFLLILTPFAHIKTLDWFTTPIFKDRNEALLYVLKTNECIFMYITLVSMLLNMALCHDLVKLLESPFIVARTRLTIYYTFSFTLPLFIILLILAMAD